MSKTLFLIHGMWGGGWCWENYLPFLESRGYRCIVPTLRYHDVAPADSPNPLLRMTSLLDYAEDLENEIRRLEEPPVIVGHSMGGLLAQMLAARGLAKRLVLLTPAAPAGIRSVTPSVLRSFFRIQVQWGFWRKPMRPSFAAFVYSSLHLVPLKEQRRAYDRLVYDSGWAAFEMGYWWLDPKNATKVDAQDVTCPVLITGSAQDRIIPASVVRKVAKRYADVATYREFDNHAHWILGEPGWEKVAECVVEWLRTCP